MSSSDVEKMWFELSNGLEPDEVTPEEHEEYIAAISTELGVDEDSVRERVVIWGENSSMDALRGH